MTIEAEANPAPVADDVRNDGVEAEVLDTELNDGEDDSLEAGETDNLEPETITIERNGKTFTVPKELEGELLMQQDYTKKTMTLAQEREAAKAEIEAERQAVALRSADIDVWANLRQLEATKAEYERLDRTQLAILQRDDPAAFDKLERDYDRIDRQIAQAKTHLEQRTREVREASEREAANTRAQALAEAAKVIPNFTDERRTALEKLAIEKGGYSADQIKLASAGDYALLDLAAEGLKARQARQAAAKQKAAASAQPAAEVVQGRTPVVKALDDRASIDAWMKARNAKA